MAFQSHCIWHANGVFTALGWQARHLLTTHVLRLFALLATPSCLSFPCSTAINQLTFDICFSDIFHAQFSSNSNYLLATGRGVPPKLLDLRMSKSEQRVERERVRRNRSGKARKNPTSREHRDAKRKKQEAKGRAERKREKERE